jgi:hypothetical protein
LPEPIFRRITANQQLRAIPAGPVAGDRLLGTAPRDTYQAPCTTALEARVQAMHATRRGIRLTGNEHKPSTQPARFIPVIRAIPTFGMYHANYRPVRCLGMARPGTPQAARRSLGMSSGVPAKGGVSRTSRCLCTKGRGHG